MESNTNRPKTDKENLSKRVLEKLKNEYESIVGEPDFVAVPMFRIEYPEYAVRKFK